MFLINSRYPLPSATSLGFGREALNLPKAHLLPRLRWQFAEFLNRGSLKRLGMLYPSTCVGLRYGQQDGSLRGFSREHGINHFRRSVERRRHRVSALKWGSGFAYRPRLHAWNCTSNRSPAYPSASPHRDNEDKVVQEC